MAIEPVLLAKINEGYRSFIEKVNQKSERFYVTEGNRQSLIAWLKKEQFPLESWEDRNVWMAAFASLDDDLEKRPVEVRKTSEQLATELEARDRKPGSPVENKSRLRKQKSAEEELREMARGVEERRKQIVAGLEAAAESAASRRAAQNDFSQVPDGSVELGKAELSALASITTAHLKLYMQRRREYLKSNPTVVQA